MKRSEGILTKMPRELNILRSVCSIPSDKRLASTRMKKLCVVRSPADRPLVPEISVGYDWKYGS